MARATPTERNQWDELVATGSLVPARTVGPLPFVPVESNVSLADTLSDLRCDRP